MNHVDAYIGRTQNWEKSYGMASPTEQNGLVWLTWSHVHFSDKL